MATIVICDDDERFYEMLAEFLQSLGHEVFMAHEPSDLAMVLAARKPQVVFMDMQMPGGGGPEAMKALARFRELGEAGLIFCSGMPVDKMKEWFPEGPRRRYLQKPVDLAAAKAFVEELLAIK